jgi:hypothetical protein
MNALASFIMRGPLQAILLIVVSGALTLILPPVSIFTGGVLALVTLRNGVKAGLTVLSGAALILGLFALIAMPDLMVAYVVSLLITIAPVWMLAVVLRSTISLARTLNAALVMGLVVVLVAHAILPEPAQWWEEVLTKALAPAIDQTQIDPETFNFVDNIKAMSAMMTGLIGAAMMGSYVMSLLLGRWMQALLYNPGGFKQEFQGLRLGYQLALAAVVTLAVALMIDGGLGDVAQDMAWVFGALYAFTGLSVIHYWINTLSKPTIWLVVTYVLLLFVPQAIAIMAMIGWLDTWVNMRARLSK